MLTNPCLFRRSSGPPSVRATTSPADYSHRGDYLAKHGVTPAEVDEAIADPDRAVLNDHAT